MIFTHPTALETATRSPAICIVGAGAAGITLACELDGCGFDVLLLETGGLKADHEATRDSYTGTALPPHPQPTEFRRSGLGGTTSIWGGRLVPFDPIDFERREHVSESGWPISYDEVARHYPRALHYVHGGHFDFTVSGSIDRPRPTMPGLVEDGDVLLERIERYSLPTDFGREHRRQLERSSNVHVLMGLRCVRLQKRDDGAAIESAEIVDRAGNRASLRARRFVVACGGIETTRLLFASDPEGPGLGNHSDRLGRYYSCHFEKVCGTLVAGRRVPIAFDFEKTRDGVYCRRKLQFSDATQRANRLLNSSFRLHFPDYSDARHGSGVLSTIYLAKSALIQEYRNILQHGREATVAAPRLAHLRNLVVDAPGVLRFGYKWVFQRALARRKLPYTLIANADGSYPIEYNSEQIPLASSRITIGDDIDRHGLRRVHVDWRVCDDDVRAAARAFLTLRDAIGATTPCRVELDEATLESQLRGAVPVGGHHIGTTRMAATARDGVVDRDCAVFGLPNCFVSSAATFPTNSHANPTLTIVAMAVRLAAHLKAHPA